MSSTSLEPALLASPPAGGKPEAPIIIRVARRHGVSPLRQLVQMMQLRWSQSRVSPREYYAAGLFRPTLDAAARGAFVGTLGNLRLNRATTSAASRQMTSFHADKLMLAALLSGFGVPTPETQAVFAAQRQFGALPVLRDAGQIATFLRSDARYPVFAKPLRGSLSVGSTRIDAFDAASDTVLLGSGRSLDVTVLAEEIATSHPTGYLFQTRILPHPEMAAVAGTALGTVRVVTVADKDGPQVLYAVWKLPSRNALSDSSWQEGNMQALVDIDSGRVLRCGCGTGLEVGVVERHPDSGLPIPGFQLPHWDAVMQTARAAHSLLPECGILGWDIGITAEGPVVLEANNNPFHMLYQRAADRGILNEEFLPVFRRLRASAAAANRRQRKGRLRRLFRR